MDSSVADRNLDPKHTWWYKFFMRVIVRYVMMPIGKRILRIKTERYKGEMPRRPFIMVFNHTSDYDFIGTVNGVPEYGRYIMSDELIKMPLMRHVIFFVTNGIYRRKGENADNVVKAVRTTLDKGINVYFAAEGEETFNGVTAPIRGRTGQMLKDMNVDVMVYKMEGGYLTKPKWSTETAKGPLYGRMEVIHKKEELQKMTPDEINELIAKDLYFNIFDWEKENHIPYDRKNRAVALEKILYKCPKCGSMNRLHSEHHDLYCLDCGYRVSMNVYGLFEGEGLIYDNIYDWDVWQKECLKEERPKWEANPDDVITSDENCRLVQMIDNDTKELDENVSIAITFNNIIIKGEKTDIVWPVTELSGLTSVRNGVGISYNGEYFKVLLNDLENHQRCMLRYRTIRRIIMNRSDY